MAITGLGMDAVELSRIEKNRGRTENFFYKKY